MASKNPEDASSSMWESLGPVDQARDWETFRPGTFEQVFTLAREDAVYRRNLAEQAARHERRLDYIAIVIQFVALTFALVALAILVWIAKYYIDHHAAEAGASILSIGAGSIVAAFVGVQVLPILRRAKLRTRTKR